MDSYRFWIVLLVLPLGVAFGLSMGPTVERLFFAGDFFLWLDGKRGTGASGWMFFLLPLSAVLTGWFFSRVIDPPLRERLAPFTRFQASIVAIVRFLAGTAIALTLAWCASWTVNALGWDPRGAVLGAYDQRNALIVGFVMGFAIIPIIYTISEDALSAVPEQLRSASLGAGATHWQTATRIVFPAAMSGLFSAVMVGLGRAVGETMIVLMAAGGTPILDWNPFNGFKTLSVNIANELPEAAVGSTHYRILFLSAVVLFVLTSILNTVAEAVRIRFRRRAVQL
jgi:phosphate transport system permease protein